MPSSGIIFPAGIFYSGTVTNVALLVRASGFRAHHINMTGGAAAEIIIFRVPIKAAVGNVAVTTTTLTVPVGVHWRRDRGIDVGSTITITAAEDAANNASFLVTGLSHNGRTITVVGAALLTANADDDAMIVTREYFRVSLAQATATNGIQSRDEFHFVHGLEILTASAAGDVGVTIAYFRG